MGSLSNIEIMYAEWGKCSFELLEAHNGVEIYRFYYAPEVPKESEMVLVQWRISSADVFCTWNPMSHFERGLRTVYTAGIKNESCINSSAPVQSLIAQDGRNVFTMAISDAVTTICINTQVDEETMEILCQLQFFVKPFEKMTSYEAFVRIDWRKLQFYEILADVEKWWSFEIGMYPAVVPISAKEAVYSTWYSYHHSISCEAVLEECKKAIDMGMKTVIIDDGWQKSEIRRAWSGCGDWKVKNPAMCELKKMVEAIHGLGMKCMLWYSVPFVSTDTDLWEQFHEYVIADVPGKNCYLLDVRYPQIRQFLIDIYEKAIIDWNLDGLKLDFIDSLRLKENEKKVSEQMEYKSLEEAVERLIWDISARLKAIKPDIMLEFRQAYIGPKMRQTANILRVSDCPRDALYNRVSLADLRLISGQTAIHSDMIGWSKDEKPQDCAKQLIAVLFGVPQISVRLGELQEEQKKVLEFYLGFWKNHREVLLNGKFKAYNPEMNYSMLEAQTLDVAVTVCYGKNVVQISQKLREQTIINGCGTDGIILDYSGDACQAEIVIYDCTGRVLSEGVNDLYKGLHLITVPECGMVTIRWGENEEVSK